MTNDQSLHTANGPALGATKKTKSKHFKCTHFAVSEERAREKIHKFLYKSKRPKTNETDDI